MELAEARLIVADALARQEVEIESDFTVGNPPLAKLEQGEPDRVVELALALGGGLSAERLLAARILAGSSVSAADKYDLAVSALARESDPEVAREWVRVLQQAREPRALDVLVRLAEHEDSGIRHVVPDALSWCADGDFDRIASPLLRLSEDDDDEVRWSALYELTQWSFESDDPRIATRLAKADDDSWDKIQELMSLYRSGGLGP